MAGPHPRFSPAEYTRRWAALDTLLESEGIDVAVVAGGMAGRHELQFLCNAPVRWESFLVIGGGLEPHLFVQLYNHVPTMTSWSVVPTSWAGLDPASAVSAHLRAFGHTRGSIGLLGPWSERAAEALRHELPTASFRSIGTAFARTRLTKSDEELAWVATAAAMCDAAVHAFCTNARPGMREDELVHVLEAGYASQGGQTGIAFVAVSPAAGGGAVVPSQAPSARRVEAGDVAIFELSAGIGGYTGQILRTVAIGGEACAPARDLHAVAEAALESIVAAIRPGSSAEELEALGAIIDRVGLTIVDDLVHGYVGGYLPPVLRTPATRHRTPPDMVLEAGMCLVVQPNVVSADGGFGVQTGELVAVTEGPARRFHQAPRGLLRAG